jgi:hypothetical protein
MRSEDRSQLNNFIGTNSHSWSTSECSLKGVIIALYILPIDKSDISLSGYCKRVYVFVFIPAAIWRALAFGHFENWQWTAVAKRSARAKND